MLCIYCATSCRFGKPLLSFNHEKDTIYIDSLKQTRVINVWDYFHIGRYFKGGYVVSRFYDNKKRLVEKEISKVTGLVYDGAKRSFLKEVFYDSLSHVIKIHKSIFQNHGIGGRIVLDKTIFFDGKKKTIKNDTPIWPF